MPWFVPQWSESIKKRLCRYLLQRYLGQFLEEKLTLDQLTIDLYNGKGIVKDVSLDVNALNELAEQQSMPVWFVRGSVATVSVSIPWSTLLSDASYVEVCGLHVTVQPKVREENCASMLESMWNSLSSSMQLAEECLKQEALDVDAGGAPLEGLELFAQTIDSILSRVKVRFIDTTMRLEHVPDGSLVGVALEIKIGQMTYLDEAGMDEPNLEEEESGKYQVSAFTTKKFSMEAVKFYTDEFKACDFTTEFEDRESLGQHSKILAAQLAGRQEVRLQMKQSENIRGPKVSLEILMGSLTIFLSPRQLHGLLALAGGLTSPSGHDNPQQQQQGRQKPMEARDFHLVEQDLQHRLMPTPSPQRFNQGWSAAAGESDDDEEFLPMKGRSGMVNSMLSSTDSMASSMTASTVSSVSSFAHKCLAAGMPAKEPRKKSQRRVAKEESWSTDTTTFSVRASSLAVVLLQEDILVCQSNITEASTRQLSDTVAAFFASLGDLASVGFGVKDFERARQVFSKACSRNHLRLLAAPVMIEGTERTGSTGHVTEGSMTMARLEVLEVLPEQPGQDSDLLKFNGPPAGAPLSLTPDLQLKFSRSQKHTPPKHLSATPRTNLKLQLQACLVEVDISLMDRVSALLSPPMWVTPSKVSRDTWHEAVEMNPASTESFLDLALLCPLLTVKLRFPRADLRPLSDMMRTPYWVRSVHPDWLLLELGDAALTCKLDSRDPTTHIELSGRQLTLFFQQQQEEEQRVQLLTASAEEAGMSLPGGGADFGLLRATLTVHPVATPSDLAEPVGCDTDDTDDNWKSLETRPPRQPSPFSAKRVVHESDTPHGTSADSATDELLIPGDKREMAEFIELASLRSRVHLELCLPSGRLTVPSKHLYELVYNRLSTDLLLWEPARPNNSDTNKEPSLAPSAFAMCKSSLNLYSDSDSSSDSEGVFHSTHEQRLHSRQQAVIRHSGQSLFTLALNLGQGIISFCTPLRDLTGCVIPNQRGELRLHVVEGSLFLVSSHRGDPSLSYVCVQANQASLHHCGLVPANVEDAAVLPTIVQTGSGAVVRTGMDPVGKGAQCSLDMLTVALSIHMDEPNSLKMIRVAAGVRGATLLHRVVPGPQTWLSQMIDMLDVLDFPVPGYTPPRVLTELHLHLWDCAIDYRPVNLPVRAVVTLGSFAISSNLAAATRSSSLRFIAEECAFFLSPRKLPGPAELRRDYVCVLELGLFELALRLSEDPRAPKVDLRASTTAVHVRTCADSCRTLMELITYFASDGDLVEPRSTTPAPAISTSQQQAPCHAELVPDMLEEAMQDTAGLSSTAQEATHTKEKKLEDEAAFCFPGDAAVRKNSEDDDEEFCILGEDPGTGIMPASGQPEVRRLVTGPLCVAENHFAVPLGRSDPLQAPPHYPVPELRYTLCDLALVWYIYGGCDFDNSKRHVTYTQDAPQTWDAPVQGSSTVEFSKSNPHEVHFCGSAKSSPSRHAQLSWQARGGSRRDHDTLMELHVNKVRFLHESYPESASVASRQVLLVQSLEVRDRLASSAINKFLYMHCTEAQPRQAHAYMVAVKALHERPDPSLPSQQECCLRLSLLPLRLNIDQDALLFLCNFFAELGASTSVAEADVEVPRTPPAHAPVMSVQGTTSVPPSTSEQLLPTLRTTEDDVQGSPPVFFRTLLFSPDVLVRLDYQGKRVDMTHGPLAGLLMGLAQLNCSELKLKRLAYRHGLLGVDKLVSYMMSEWLTDIKKNQLPSVLGGVGPMHSFVQLFQGVRDLVLLPIEQYQRDGRLVRGLQRGAHSFTSSTAMAALELTNRLVHAVQVTAETAYDMLSPGPSVRQRRLFGPTSRSRRSRARYSQPADIREGVANAYHLVQEGLGETAWNLVAVASAEHEEKGMYGAVGGVLRQIPPTVVTPILLGAEAASSVLGGVRSQLAPDVRREAAQKWRTQSPQ